MKLKQIIFRFYRFFLPVDCQLNIPDFHVRLSKAMIFSKIDLKSTYYQTLMHPNLVNMTAFVCEF